MKQMYSSLSDYRTLVFLELCTSYCWNSDVTNYSK